MDDIRYLLNFNSKDIETEYHDVIIIGSGIAGVYTALVIPEEFDIAIITKETIDISNSVLAQGGIAVSLDKEDSPELHFKDTLVAGAGLCDEESVWVLVNEAAANIDCICKFGVNFDKKGKDLALTREGAHSKNRIIHAGDTTGKEVCDKLIAEVRTRKNVIIKERSFAVDLLTDENVCKGILVYDEDSSSLKMYLSNFVVCATGGFGQIYKNTTNPEVATGDGISLAYRAGAQLMDMEFIQFHPTVLYHPQNKSFLISEAVRGEGALLLNDKNERFMPSYHKLCELAPRDIVSRAIFEEMRKTEEPNVFLDITFKHKEYLENRFPNILKTCLSYGIDLTKDLIPVSPAEHYCMGGIKTDVFGRTNIQGFYACGEAACTGIHGANRLASNSLLEGLVFGQKIGQLTVEELKKRDCKSIQFSKIHDFKRQKIDFDKKEMKRNVQDIMTKYVGIIRDEKGLTYAANMINDYFAKVQLMEYNTIEDFELNSIVLLSKLVIESALERKESRGAHFRADFSKTDDLNWRRNIIIKNR
ncbi:MAG: L-aspartate oxidase [Bacillota bacterium]|nr:L-aspartate oxidase [Bacillota bacterium]